MPKAIEAIVALHDARVTALRDDHADMQAFRDHLEGHETNYLPELDKNEKSAIANLAKQGLRQMALRVGSMVPEVDFPALKPGIKVSEDKARNRKKATLGWWQRNDMQAVLTARGEYLFADGLSAVTVLPDPKTGVPTWRVRDSLTCLPAPSHNPLNIIPDNCIFLTKQSWAHLKAIYGNRVAELGRARDCGPDTKFTVLEYIDAEEIVTICLPSPNQDYDHVGVNTPCLLDRIPNRAETPLTFIPGFDSVIGRKGQFNGSIGTHQMRARLLSLAYITAKRGAIPDAWVEPIDNASTPDFTAIPNQRTGTPGVIKGGRLRYIEPNPGFMTSPMLSILEREARLGAGMPAEFGGESSSNVRTARRGNQLIEAAVDFPIQQAHDRLAKSLECENKAAFAIAKKWTPGARSFYVSWKGSKGWADYDPNVDFETDEHTVTYPFSGSDMNDATVRHAQLVGTGQLSKKTARKLNPEIPDEEYESDQVEAEQVQEAFWQSVMTKVADPASRWGPSEVALLAKLIRTDKKDMFAAVQEIEDRMAEQQAEAAPVPDALPGVMGAPAEPPAAIPEVGEGLANLSAQLRANYPVNQAMGIPA